MSAIVKTAMPEDGQTDSLFSDLLNEVDDPEFDKKLTRSKSSRLKSLLNLLQAEKVPTKEEAEEMLMLCTGDDPNCLAYEVAIISKLVKITQNPLASPAHRSRRPNTEMLSPLLLIPLERGWKRELVYRAALDPNLRRNADIYYYTPQGKKLRSSREVAEHLSGTDLTLEHFTFFKEPLGLDDPEKEIIRDAKLMRRMESSSSSPAPAPVNVEITNHKSPAKLKLINTLDADILLSSALFLLDLLKNPLITSLKLKSLTIEIILSYPETVLIKLVVLHSTKIFEAFENDHKSFVSQNEMEILHLLKILTLIPSDQARAFVKQGHMIWLSRVIPMAMSYMALNNGNPANKLVYVLCLELLTDFLVTTDYFENTHFISFIESICNIKKYPSIIKTLLENDSDIWHRLWIVIIKLLNNHITKNIGGFGTPINSMLPVVESAFKMHAIQRIRAFECWNKLIDNFSKETNENCIAKRIKLLIIPLKLNNAKTEDIALAKFDTWWHLIRSFDYKSDRFCNEVFMPFLYFVFGKSGTQKPGVPAAQLSNRLKRKSLEAFVEIVGHTDCNCSVDIPKLKNKMLNMKLLLNNWNDWMYCLSNAFKNAGNPAVYEVSTKNYLKCTWKTMVQLIAELPDNAVRRDIFTEMLNCLMNMLQEPQSTDQLHDIIVTSVMSSLFDGSAKMQELLKTKTDKYKPLFMITSAFTNISMNRYYLRFTEEQLINLFKPITKLVLEDAVQQENCFFMCLVPNKISLQFWAATMDNLSELNTEISSEMLRHLMEWPLKSLEDFKEAKIPGIKWYNVYNINHKKLNCTEFNKEVSMYITPNLETLNYFTVCVTIAVLKHRLLNKESLSSMPKLLENFTSSIKDYEEFKEIIPLSVDTIVVMLNNVAEKIDIELAKTATSCAKNLLSVIIAAIEKNECDNKTAENLLVLLTNLNKAINPLLKENAYTDSILELVEELSSHLTNIRKESPLFNCIVTHMKTYRSLTNNEAVKEKINNVIEPKQKTNINNQKKIIFEPVKVFTTPDVNKVKKIKKTEVNIVNKVVENGEEYVVVKSNWKFNPKKLTENQKEKFQRKREDIPALYQDLSQSQDDIKLSTWKTDSQDCSSSTSTSTTISKSNRPAPDSKVTFDDVLKNLPNTDVVPKIMENILQESDKRIDRLQVNDIETTKDKTKNNGSLTLIVKTAKSPRMALKDRVFRNMKNLLEKYTPPKDKTEIDPDHTENIPKTPLSRPNNDMNVANSAPPMLAADRPSRMKRRPKKFDDTELFALKKRRHSQNGSVESNSQNDLPLIQINKSEAVENAENVIMEESEQKTVENNSNKKTEQVVVKDDVQSAMVHAESSLTTGVETKNLKEEPCVMSKIPDAEVNQVIIESSNVSESEPPVALSEKETVKDVVIETIVISESEAHTEPKDVPDGVVKTDTVPETKIEQNVIIQPKLATETVEALPATPIHKVRVASGPKSSTKKSAKKSRIEKELAIDMVEGHPFLKLQTEKRLTRKKLIETELSNKRKSVAEKLNKSKSEATPKSTKKTREKKTSPTTQTSITVHESQEASQPPKNVLEDEPACSEDVIESSQDSTITTISVKPTKKTAKRQPIIAVERMKIDIGDETQNLLQDSDIVLEPNKMITEEKDDTILPQNKTVETDRNQSQLTENMDTEPISSKDITEDVIIINDNEDTPITINTEPIIVGCETQEIAEADTQPNNTVDFIEIENTNNKEAVEPIEIDLDKKEDVLNDIDQTIPEITITDDRPLQADSITEAEKESELSSPFKDCDQRKKDFLSNTLEISPIKIQSPDRDKKSPSPETSSDYVVIKLSSPVHSNGEPFEKHGSPEFFTDDKISPEKREISPPRAEIGTVNNTSPSSSLSLKKNKPQVRPGGRAAHMLGLCVPEKMNSLKMADRSEPEEVKKASTPARRNLRILYNTVSDNNESTDNEESENFLKLKRSLPSVDSSPAGPILKRKLCDIADETTTSPASKRKRVSFHDPPVSTTVSVQKYIEPIGLRSPQNSAQKRLERQTRQSQYSKSPKRLDNVFKLETVLSKAVESFTEGDQPTPLTSATPEDTQTSLEVTPAIEIVKTSDLNDTDPIFLKLVDCNDPIIVIAAELSSPSLKHLFVKQVEDKIKTVGDLAKMTEVEICRLCIKAPKVKVVKKVLSDYAAKIEKPLPTVELIEEAEMIEINPVTEMEAVGTHASIEIQTDEVSQSDIEVQTIVEPLAAGSTQTDALSVADTDVQTDESGSKTTADVITTCIHEREDFVEKLSEMLDESSIRRVAEKLPTDTLFDVLLDKQSTSGILGKILATESLTASGNRRSVQKSMTFISDYMSQHFQSKDLILFCSQLLQKVHDRDRTS